MFRLPNIPGTDVQGSRHLAAKCIRTGLVRISLRVSATSGGGLVVHLSTVTAI